MSASSPPHLPDGKDAPLKPEMLGDPPGGAKISVDDATDASASLTPAETAEIRKTELSIKKYIAALCVNFNEFEAQQTRARASDGQSQLLPVTNYTFPEETFPYLVHNTENTDMATEIGKCCRLLACLERVRLGNKTAPAPRPQ